MIVCLVILLAFTSQAPAAGEAQGRLYDARGGWKELFPWCTRVGDGHGVRRPADSRGGCGAVRQTVG
ncbi:MAG: hypothetical protein AMXMBFR13_01580 [Phycisphaerae bacterium]